MESSCDPSSKMSLGERMECLHSHRHWRIVLVGGVELYVVHCMLSLYYVLPA